MIPLSDSIPVHQTLIWRDDQGNSLSLTLIELGFIQKDDRLTTCGVTVQIPWEQFQQIESGSLFNLQVEFRSPLSSGPFQPDLPLRLEACLDPELWPLLRGKGDLSQLADTLQTLSEDDPLLFHENWYGLQISQVQAEGETGYTSLWAYLSPDLLGQDPLPTQALSEAMLAFSQVYSQEKSAEGLHGEVPIFGEIEQADVITQVTQTVESLLGQFTEELEGSLSGIADEIVASFSEALEPLNTILEETEIAVSESEPVSGGLFDLLMAFFQEENWLVQPVDSEPLLLALYQGRRARWECYAESREEDHQILFYSVCPLQVPDERRVEMAEFICRANWGLTIGNFELEWDQGQIRYKTSADVELAQWSLGLVRTLVYTNVLVMETYLPGIKAVIDDGSAPVEAIRLVEETLESEE